MTRDKSISTYADNGIAFSGFHLFPLYFSSGPYIVKKKERNAFHDKQVVFESRYNICINDNMNINMQY